MENLERCLYFIFIGGNHLNASHPHDGRCLPNAICVRVCARAYARVHEPPKTFKTVRPPCAFRAPVVGPGIRPRRRFLSPPTDVVFPPPLLSATEFNKTAGRALGVAANTSRGGGEVEVVGRGGGGGDTPLGEGRGNFSSRSRRRCHGDTEILRRRAACAELGAERGEERVSTCRQRDGSQQLSCPEIKSFFFYYYFILFIIHSICSRVIDFHFTRARQSNRGVCSKTDGQLRAAAKSIHEPCFVFLCIQMHCFVLFK